MRLALRFSIIALAAAALAVCAMVLPMARQIDRSRAIQSQLLNKQDYPFDVINRTRQDFRQSMPAQGCLPDGEAADVMMTAWLADHSFAQMRPALLDSLQQDTLRTAARAIRCNPLHPLGWLAHARFNIISSGVSEHALAFIRHSYTIAPYEGWVMRMRAGMLIGLRKSLAGNDRARLMYDLRGLVVAEANNDVVDLLSRTELEFQREVGQHIAALPFREQRRYQTAAIQVGVDVTRLTIPPSWSEPIALPGRVW